MIIIIIMIISFNEGKMVFIFSENSWQPLLISSYSVPKMRIYCQIVQFLFAIWSCLLLVKKENAVIFLQGTLVSKISCLSLVSMKGRCCSFIQRIRGKQIWSPLFFGVKQGKVPSICHAVIFSKLILSNTSLQQGRCCQFLRKVGLVEMGYISEGKSCWILDLLCFQCQKNVHFCHKIIVSNSIFIYCQFQVGENALQCLHIFQGIRGTHSDIT